MVTTEEFWEKLRLGKWREEVVGKDVFNRLIKTFFGFFGLVLYVTVLQIILISYPSALPKIDFFAPLSIIITIVLSMIAIAVGFQTYFIQKRVGPGIITYCGIIEYQNIRGAITFINRGDTTTIMKHAALFAMKDTKGIRAWIRAHLSGLPSFDFYHSATVFHGWRLLKGGECAGIEEKRVKSALNEIILRLENEKDVEDLYISVLIFDEEFNIKDPGSISKNLLGGCKLGKYRELIAYAKGETDQPFGHKTYFKIEPEDIPKIMAGQSALVEMIPEMPPNVIDMDFEIWKKLDNIEKLLKKGKEKS
jgi:hypothetical protein